MPSLLPQTYRNIERYRDTFWRDEPPAFSYPFQNLTPSARLTYELVTWNNVNTYLRLFKNDSNPYVMDDFKTRAGLEQYAVHLLEYGGMSTKRGACDWLLRTEDGQYAGVLHLHGLSREFMDGRLNPCMIGYAIAEPFRRCGYASEAAAHLLAQLPTLFRRYEVIATVHPANRASQAVLRKVGFRWKEKYSNDQSAYYKKLIDPIPLHTIDDLISGLI